MTHNMSTTNRGKIIDSSQRGTRAWSPGNVGLNGANIIEEPADFVVGSQGETGIMDQLAATYYPDCFTGAASEG
jgi:hypothetical protein